MTVKGLVDHLESIGLKLRSDTLRFKIQACYQFSKSSFSLNAEVGGNKLHWEPFLTFLTVNWLLNWLINSLL